MVDYWNFSEATGLGFIMDMVIFNEWEQIGEIKMQEKT